MKTYLVVTNDELEQPVAEFVGAKKTCEFLGISTNYLYFLLSNNGRSFPKKAKYKVVIIKDMQYYHTKESGKARELYTSKMWRMRKGV